MKHVFIRSMVVEVVVDMRNYCHWASKPWVCDNEGWLLNNLIGIQREREIHAKYECYKNGACDM